MIQVFPFLLGKLPEFLFFWPKLSQTCTESVVRGNLFEKQGFKQGPKNKNSGSFPNKKKTKFMSICHRLAPFLHVCYLPRRCRREAGAPRPWTKRCWAWGSQWRKRRGWRGPTRWHGSPTTGSWSGGPPKEEVGWGVPVQGQLQRERNLKKKWFIAKLTKISNHKKKFTMKLMYIKRTSQQILKFWS